ncbi:tyrosine-type recombinase/integrase [Cognatiluteimonas telluris]|uniref:tyrosine-type recombinase/integrase n=1 Tax=Cognatiluteimonas telluris TaxID=1104775 RepID=UPI0014088359|nr:tyrosine-type recombinase/integrase [Lysobacter telluris]
MRQREGDGYRAQRLGTPDDQAAADGAVVLSYAQAVRLATTTQLEARTARPKHYGDGQTLDAVMADYFDSHLAGKGSETISRQSYRLHAGALGPKLITALSADTLRKWHRAIASRAPTNRGKVMPFDPADPEQARARKATANRVLSIVKAGLNFAWRNETLPAELPTFWQKVEPFELGDDPPPRMLERGEITRLLNAAPVDLRDLLTAALMTGGRYSEIRRLQVRDYSPDHSTVRIYQSKTGKTLLQPLTAEGVAFFDRVTAGKAPTAPIFTKADGEPWGQSDANKPVRAAVEAARLDDVSFKTTRATYGKLLLLATKDLEMVAKALGHSDSRVTRKHYAQYLPNEVAKAVAKMPRLGVMVGEKVSRIDGKKRRAG